MSDSLTHSKDKVRRFVRFFLSLQQPEFFFHQTLTFPTPVTNSTQAKAQLKKLLERELFQGVLYVQERHGNGGIHFHTLLYFYAQHGLPFAPSKMREGVAAEVFSAWNAMNGGALSKGANRLQQWVPNFETIHYLTKEARHAGTRETGETNWWGKRNDALLVRNPEPPTKPEVQQWMKLLYPRVPLPLGLRCTMRGLLREKKDFLATSLAPNDWEDFKKREMGVRKSVSDEEYLRFRKRLASEWRALQRSVARLQTR